MVRFTNLGFASVTHTEAWRANWMWKGQLEDARRFPPLQFVLGHWLQHTFGRSETIIRTPYALAGVICVLAVYGLTQSLSMPNRSCRERDDTFSIDSRNPDPLGSPYASLAAAALVMSHPVLVYYSRRQLEYSFEAAAAAMLFWAGLAAWRRRTVGGLFVFVLAGIVGLGFTFTSSLVLAAWLPVLAWAYLRGGDGAPRRPGAFGAAVAALAVVGIAWYGWLSGFRGRGAMVHYYAVVEPAWPRETTLSALASWGSSAAYGALHFVLGMSDTWAPLNWFLGSMALLAACAALSPLWKRARPLGLVALLLLSATFTAGALRLWPLGNLRHVTFLIPVACVVVGLGIAELVRRLGRTAPSALVLGACLLIPSLRAVKATVIDPTADEHSRPVFEYITHHRQPGDALFVYYFARDAFEYYGRDDSMPVLVQPGSDRGNHEAFASRFAEWMTQHERVWFLFAHDWKGERAQWLELLKSRYRFLDQHEQKDAAVYLFASNHDSS